MPMSLAERIGPHLPMLRRYARALCGSQASGDTYVRVVLEAMIAEPQQFDVSLPPRLALFQLFHRVWQAVGQDIATAAPDARGKMKIADQRLSRLTPQNRQVLLLTAMEGFTIEETAVILSLEPEQVKALLAAAEDEIQQALAAKILIIEDEPVIALDISSLVEELGHRVTNITATRHEAVTAAAHETPDLVLADIQLADGSSGIDAAAEILSKISVPVIFITAFPERLLTGRRVEPTFLITKPFVPAAVRAAISQALFFKQHARRLSS
jgi:CheY-like chemotaxis protein